MQWSGASKQSVRAGHDRPQVAALAANPKKFIKKPANKGKQARADQQREEALQRQQLLFRQEAPVDPPPDGQAAVRARRAQAADGSQEPEPGDQLTGRAPSQLQRGAQQQADHHPREQQHPSALAGPQADDKSSSSSIGRVQRPVRPPLRVKQRQTSSTPAKPAVTSTPAFTPLLSLPWEDTAFTRPPSIGAPPGQRRGDTYPPGLDQGHRHHYEYDPDFEYDSGSSEGDEGEGVIDLESDEWESEGSVRGVSKSESQSENDVLFGLPQTELESQRPRFTDTFLVTEKQRRREVEVSRRRLFGPNWRHADVRLYLLRRAARREAHAVLLAAAAEQLESAREAVFAAAAGAPAGTAARRDPCAAWQYALSHPTPPPSAAYTSTGSKLTQTQGSIITPTQPSTPPPPPPRVRLPRQRGNAPFDDSLPQPQTFFKLPLAWRRRVLAERVVALRAALPPLSPLAAARLYCAAPVLLCASSATVANQLRGLSRTLSVHVDIAAAKVAAVPALGLIPPQHTLIAAASLTAHYRPAETSQNPFTVAKRLLSQLTSHPWPLVTRLDLLNRTAESLSHTLQVSQWAALQVVLGCPQTVPMARYVVCVRAREAVRLLRTQGARDTGADGTGTHATPTTTTAATRKRGVQASGVDSESSNGNQPPWYGLLTRAATEFRDPTGRTHTKLATQQGGAKGRVQAGDKARVGARVGGGSSVGGGVGGGVVPAAETAAPLLAQPALLSVPPRQLAGVLRALRDVCGLAGTEPAAALRAAPGLLYNDPAQIRARAVAIYSLLQPLSNNTPHASSSPSITTSGPAAASLQAGRSTSNDSSLSHTVLVCPQLLTWTPTRLQQMASVLSTDIDHQLSAWPNVMSVGRQMVGVGGQGRGAVGGLAVAVCMRVAPRALHGALEAYSALQDPPRPDNTGPDALRAIRAQPARPGSRRQLVLRICRSKRSGAGGAAGGGQDAGVVFSRRSVPGRELRLLRRFPELPNGEPVPDATWLWPHPTAGLLLRQLLQTERITTTVASPHPTHPTPPTHTNTHAVPHTLSLTPRDELMRSLLSEQLQPVVQAVQGAWQLQSDAAAWVLLCVYPDAALQHTQDGASAASRQGGASGLSRTGRVQEDVATAPEGLGGLAGQLRAAEHADIAAAQAATTAGAQARVGKPAGQQSGPAANDVSKQCVSRGSVRGSPDTAARAAQTAKSSARGKARGYVKR